MKSKLLSAIAMPAALAIGAATALAQTPPPSPSPAPSPPAENMPETTPAPAPAPSATDPAPSTGTPSAVDKSADAATNSAGTFAATQAADEWRSTKLVGLSVFNSAGDRVGDINDLILGPDGKISNVVIGVGGFLGMGEKLVAVSFSDLQLNRDSDGSMRVTINSSKDALENAPDFAYYVSEPAKTK